MTSSWNSVHWIDWSKKSEISKSMNCVRFPRVPSKLCIGIFILKTDNFFPSFVLWLMNAVVTSQFCVLIIPNHDIFRYAIKTKIPLPKRLVLFQSHFRNALYIEWHKNVHFNAHLICNDQLRSPRQMLLPNAKRHESISESHHRGETSTNATEAKLLVFSASEGGSSLLRSQKVNMADKNDSDRLVFM